MVVFEHLFSSLHCGTRYLIAVLARPTAQVPRWPGNVSGDPGSIPGRFSRTCVPSFRRCSAEPLHSGSVKYRDVVRPLHRPMRYRVRGWRRLEKTKKRFQGIMKAFSGMSVRNVCAAHVNNFSSNLVECIDFSDLSGATVGWSRFSE